CRQQQGSVLRRVSTETEALLLVWKLLRKHLLQILLLVLGAGKHEAAAREGLRTRADCLLGYQTPRRHAFLAAPLAPPLCASHPIRWVLLLLWQHDR
ncbi:hypothetical protein AMECASPLE_021445, partial [Ameca splendens]